MAEPTKTSAEFEKERMTRRAALRKFGFGAGMAALMALSVDDLARMAARKLQQHAGDSRVANAVAREFKNSGVAFASPSSPSSPYPPECQACLDAQGIEYDRCYVANGGVFAPNPNPHPPTNTNGFNTCTAAADNTFLSCWEGNHC